MSDQINYDATQLIQSQSPVAPFSAIFEEEDGICVFYAIALNNDAPKVVDQVLFSDDFSPKECIIQWNQLGTRVALIADERIVAIFDFDDQVTHAHGLYSAIESNWSRKELEFSNALAIEFGIDQFFKQVHLDQAIDHLANSDTQLTRLSLYKQLLKSQLFVPITTDSPDDPNALIYTFPNDVTEDVTQKGDLVCCYTNIDQFNDQIGQFGLGVQKISADFLCYQAYQFDHILGITITSANLGTVLLTRDEFKLLSLISQPQRLNTQALLNQLGDVFFDDVFDDTRAVVSSLFDTHLSANTLVRAAYYCKPMIGESKPLLCVVVNSSESSQRLTELVDALKMDAFHSLCDCHVFSLSDIMAQALEQSKQAL